MNNDKLLSEWLYNKKYDKELMQLGNTYPSCEYNGDLYRLWRISLEDIESAMMFPQFTSLLTDQEQYELNNGEDVIINSDATKNIIEYFIKYKATKARSHSKSVTGCNEFIDNHAEQTAVIEFPVVLTKINHSGFDLAALGKELKVNQKIIKEFNDMEEILAKYDYSSNDYTIVKLPEIEIFSNNGRYQPTYPSN